VNGANVIAAVFFDYDGVLTTDRTGSLTTNRYLSKASCVDYERIRAAFSPYNADLTLGKTTHKAIWRSVCRAIGQELDFSLLEKAFLSTPINAAMFGLARSLRKEHTVGIITDNKKDRIDCLRKVQELDELFSPIIVSAEVGVTKESPAMFEIALRKLRIRPEEAVFVDNTPANLVAAEALGIKTYLHDDEVNDVEKLVTTLANQHGIRFGS
jgi:HAD superfamily hydrolase (TIGR01509 family)